MPVDRPAVGELWQSVDSEGRTVRGIIAEMLSTSITLVSLTGNRYRVAPNSMLQTWSYLSPAPRTPFVCSRRGCASMAIFRYLRGQSPDYVCSRHAPSGTHLELLSDSPNFRNIDPPIRHEPDLPSISPPCPACSNPDPIEDLGLAVGNEITGWSCTRCNNRWFTLQPNSGTTFVGRWWLDNIYLIINELTRLQHPAGIVEAHPDAHVGIIREIAAQSLEPYGDTVFNVPLSLATNLEPLMVLIRPDHPARRSFSLEKMETLPALGDNLVRPGSRWVHRNGSTIEALEVRGGAVTFRQEEQKFHMLLEDFLSLHRPFVADNTPSEPLNIVLVPGEEYEGPEGIVRVVSVDSKRELVVVSWPDGRSRVPLQLREFATTKWRRIERRTAYQRILDDEYD